MAATITATLSSASANSYVTLAEANTYFETVPDSSTWTNKTDDQKNRALIAATRWIDTFVFYGDRCDNGQALKFPRNNYKVDDVELACTSIPSNIKYAQYELARALANDTSAITGTTGKDGNLKKLLLVILELNIILKVKELVLLIILWTFIRGYKVILEHICLVEQVLIK